MLICCILVVYESSGRMLKILISNIDSYNFSIDNCYRRTHGDD